MTKSIENRVIQRTRELVNKFGAPCNCGGPEYGTQHSPDCDLIRSCEDLKDTAKDEIHWEDLTNEDQAIAQ